MTKMSCVICHLANLFLRCCKPVKQCGIEFHDSNYTTVSQEFALLHALSMYICAALSSSFYFLTLLFFFSTSNSTSPFFRNQGQSHTLIFTGIPLYTTMKRWSSSQWGRMQNKEEEASELTALFLIHVRWFSPMVPACWNTGTSWPL